ncbi:response regulator [Leptolyngbya sp. FACHB-321]|uniref:response regulator n=1 Tax=Leptolyngbya sp. FACHB-321 TaxID=2692807 RepID=UPI0016885902|nr:response regulator [Leptolyngbya sp. FACHB-321]MBD2033723.1 response regulator [Leptolyngbya sp. FACHB-321]
MTPSKRFVLVAADDNPDDRLLLQAAWEETAVVDLFLVEDGEALIQFLRHQGKYVDVEMTPQPHLILLDLRMPRKNGYEVLQEIKTDPILRRIPVVVFTTSTARSDIERSYDLGANACTTKPESFEDLLQMTQTLYHYWFITMRLPS